MMKIVVNARLLRKDKMDGMGWFTYNTMKYITQKNPGIEFHFLFDSGIDESFLFSKNIVPHNLFPPAKHALLNIVWAEWSVKRYLKRIDPDLFISPDGILCLGWKGKQFGVIHDINFVHIPKDLKFWNRHYYNYFYPRFARKATRIATVSEFSKADIVKTLGIDAAKIDIVYNGINSFYEPVSEQIKTEVRAKYSNGSEYFIFVGALHPRKNIVRLMQAFEIFRQSNPASDFKLMLVGKEMYRTGELHAQQNRMQHGRDIIFTGHLRDKDLKNVFASAYCLTFVPYFEGFGIPPIEAMQCDVPVIASNVTSIPEIVGNAALLVDPYNVDEIAKAMTKVYTDHQLKNELIQKGSVQKTVFSWERSANLLWESISKIL
jgi:glycosyltransferase involved in cell wall biosynthesis